MQKNHSRLQWITNRTRQIDALASAETRFAFSNGCSWSRGKVYGTSGKKLAELMKEGCDMCWEGPVLTADGTAKPPECNVEECFCHSYPSESESEN